MIQRLLQRLAGVPQSFLVVGALLGVYALLLGLSARVPLPGVVARALFWAALLAAVLLLWRRRALARLHTERALRGGEQVVDEPVEVVSPSGVLVALDVEALRQWQGSRAPGALAPGADLLLEGPHALAAARALGLDGPHLYDVPLPALEQVAHAFRSRASGHSRRLTVRQSPQRVTHLERARRSSQDGPGVFNLRATEVLVLPTERAEVVRSWFVTGGLDTLDLRTSTLAPTRYEPLGTLDLSSDVLVLADLEVLEDLEVSGSRDELYELVLRGQVSAMASAVGGRAVRPDFWTWSDLSREDAERIQDLFVDDPAVASLLIPHSDEYLLTTQLGREPVAEVELPRGTLRAVRLGGSGPRVVSLAYHDDALVGVRVHFSTRLEDVYVLPRASRLERWASPFLVRLRAPRWPRRPHVRRPPRRR